MAQLTMPVRTTVNGGRRRTREPWRMDAMSPMKPSNRPLSFAGEGWSGNSAEVMRNGSENSRPEKGRRNRKCIRLSRYGAFVEPCISALFEVVFVTGEPLVVVDDFTGRVSGRYRYR